MPKKDARALGEQLVPLTGRFPVSVVAQIDAHVETTRRALPGVSFGRSDALRSLVMQALGTLYGSTAHAVTDTVTDTEAPQKPAPARAVQPQSRPVTDTVTDTHIQAQDVTAAALETPLVTDTVTDTSPQTKDERVAIRAVQGVTDTITDTQTAPAPGVTDTVTDTDGVTDTATVTRPAPESFDTSKFYLGKLCPRDHDYHGTGQSLRRQHNQRCRECENASKRARHQAQRTAQPVP